ncbi:glycosyltransferase [Halobacterium salinarum]|uniref:glycosyltransferase n=1 Tax=Halobacterium salinarum TaxID=2242 RepID=UPI001F25EAF9|nr:glycosyltransferase [Halobacterium salinarum]MCF2165495.1 glycosyltransferase [Halobacterium salinarum]MCF2166685.1 glycosyltransferase [Halobacterium salinarum]
MEALQDQYELSLLTVTKPDLSELNSFYGTSVENISIQRLDGTTISLVRAVSKPLPLDFKLDGLQWALLDRYAKTMQNRYDLMISTRDEIAFKDRALQYIHMPTQAAILKNGRESLPGYVGSSSLIYKLYDSVRFKVAGYDPTLVRTDRLLTNSKWTSSVIEDVYRTDSTVVYPPIDKRGFSSVDWDDREDGFVMIGRISPEKRILKAINIIRRLRECDENIHLHIIGATEDPSYLDKIRKMSNKSNSIHIEGECSRRELINFIQSHKYGIHCKESEHFGMAVAEYVVGGSIPFVHNSGGQTDIVLNDDRLVYNTNDEAVQKAKDIISDEGQQRKIQEMLADSVERFSKQTFQQRISKIVSNELENSIDE